MRKIPPRLGLWQAELPLGAERAGHNSVRGPPLDWLVRRFCGDFSGTNRKRQSGWRAAARNLLGHEVVFCSLPEFRTEAYQSRAIAAGAQASWWTPGVSSLVV